MALNYDACDTLICNQLTGYAPLIVAVKGADKIHIPNRDVDPEEFQEGILILPLAATLDPGRSSTAASVVRGWRIQWRVEGLDWAELRDIESALHEALLLLYDRLGPDRQPLEYPSTLAPLRVIRPVILPSNPELHPLLDAPEGWQDMCDVQIEFVVERSAAYAAEG